MAPTCPLPEQAFVTLREAALERMQAGAKAEVATRGGPPPGKRPVRATLGPVLHEDG